MPLAMYSNSFTELPTAKPSPIQEKLNAQIRDIEYKLRSKGMLATGRCVGQLAAVPGAAPRLASSHDAQSQVPQAARPGPRRADEEDDQSVVWTLKPPVLKLDLRGRQANGQKQQQPPPPPPPRPHVPVTTVERLDAMLQPKHFRVDGLGAVRSRQHSPDKVRSAAIQVPTLELPAPESSSEQQHILSVSRTSPSRHTADFLTAAALDGRPDTARSAISADSALPALHSPGSDGPRGRLRRHTKQPSVDWRTGQKCRVATGVHDSATQQRGRTAPAAVAQAPNAQASSGMPSPLHASSPVPKGARTEAAMSWDIPTPLLLEAQTRSQFLSQMLPVQPGIRDTARAVAIETASREYRRSIGGGTLSAGLTHSTVEDEPQQGALMPGSNTATARISRPNLCWAIDSTSPAAGAVPALPLVDLPQASSPTCDEVCEKDRSYSLSDGSFVRAASASLEPTVITWSVDMGKGGVTGVGHHTLRKQAELACNGLLSVVDSFTPRRTYPNLWLPPPQVSIAHFETSLGMQLPVALGIRRQVPDVQSRIITPPHLIDVGLMSPSASIFAGWGRGR